MPRYLTGAHSSRITKPHQQVQSQKSSFLSTKFAKDPKAAQRAQTFVSALATTTNRENDESLAGPGKLVTVVENPGVKDVLSAIKCARSDMFEELPERAGMNSVRIAEVLNFQKNLPPVVSLAHVHALRSASSKTERDIQDLLSNNQVRRLKLVGRGNEVSGLSEFLITTPDYEALLRMKGLPEEVVTSFLSILQANPRFFTLSALAISRSHLDALTRAGFLVAPSIIASRSSSAMRGESVVAPSVISRSASGSQAAVGGEAAFETLGGVNGVRKTISDASIASEYLLSVPGIAAYVKLIDAGRNHFLDLLRHFSKHKQAPVSVARRMRGEYSNVLPAKTKKWKSLNGLSFDWVMEECFGAGLIELFETHSVGLGVRALV